MPKIEIDYSNTIFYKIYCRDPSINDLYIGHTTNFVQRKHAHKQSCLNTKCSNYNCKLYDVIRKNKGWDNWKIEIIAFHECDNLMSAKKYEQKYFEDYKATLNSIEPIPKPKVKISKDIVEKKKPEVLYCDVCNIHLNSVKIQEIHNKTTNHLKQLLCKQQIETKFTQKNATVVEKITKKFACNSCLYVCRKESDYNKHLLTRKHKMITNDNYGEKHAENSHISVPYICQVCEQCYKHASGLSRHRKTCSPNVVETQQQIIAIPPSSSQDDFKEILLMLLKENKEFHKTVVEMIPHIKGNAEHSYNNTN